MQRVPRVQPHAAAAVGAATPWELLISAEAWEQKNATKSLAEIPTVNRLGAVQEGAESLLLLCACTRAFCCCALPCSVDLGA